MTKYRLYRNGSVIFNEIDGEIKLLKLLKKYPKDDPSARSSSNVYSLEKLSDGITKEGEYRQTVGRIYFPRPWKNA